MVEKTEIKLGFVEKTELQLGLIEQNSENYEEEKEST